MLLTLIQKLNLDHGLLYLMLYIVPAPDLTYTRFYQRGSILNLERGTLNLMLSLVSAPDLAVAAVVTLQVISKMLYAVIPHV